MGIITHSWARARDALATLLRLIAPIPPLSTARPLDIFADVAGRNPRTAAGLRMYCAERHAGLTPVTGADDWSEGIWQDLARELDAGTVIAIYPDGTDQPATFVWASQVPGARGPVTS